MQRPGVVSWRSGRCQCPALGVGDGRSPGFTQQDLICVIPCYNCWGHVYLLISDLGLSLHSAPLLGEKWGGGAATRADNGWDCPSRAESAALVSQHGHPSQPSPAAPSGAISPIRGFKMPLILQLELVCPQAWVPWSSSRAPATNKEFCCLWCDPAAPLSVLQTALGETRGGPGLRTLAFQLFHATGLGAFSPQAS